MARIRTIRQWGNSMVIVLSSSDVKDLNIEHMDETDIQDIIIIKKSKEEKQENGNRI